jgi:hypothetical protein
MWGMNCDQVAASQPNVTATEVQTASCYPPFRHALPPRGRPASGPPPLCVESQRATAQPSWPASNASLLHVGWIAY